MESLGGMNAVFLEKIYERNSINKRLSCRITFKSALIPWWANIPVRTGWRGEMRYGVLNDMRRLDRKRYPLMIEQFMALGLPPQESLPKDYPLPALTVLNVNHVLMKYKLTTDRPILIICPGAEFGPAKRWPEKYYATIANEKLLSGWQVWIVGSPKDETVASKIMELTQQQCINLTGKTQLEEVRELLSLARVVLSTESGLMHVASALHKPLVAVYGPTSAGFTPPLHKQAKVISLSLPCQPCFQRECPLKHHRCMEELQPKQVIDAMAEF